MKLGHLLMKTFATETPGPMSPQNNRRSGYFPGKDASFVGLCRVFPQPMHVFHPAL